MSVRIVASMLAFCAVLSAGNIFSQDYPGKTIRIIAASAGSSGDFAARLIAQGISGSLGQQIIVENRGGSVVVSGELVAKAAPDGYTLLFMPSSLWLLPFMQDNVPYDPVRDFAPITLSGRTPAILVVHPSLRVKSVKELIALAKSKPGALDYASASTGSATHVASELLKSMAGVNIIRIPYKGTGLALNGLLGGQTHMMFSTLAPALPHVKSGGCWHWALPAPNLPRRRRACPPWRQPACRDLKPPRRKASSRRARHRQR